jgi:alpha-1,2-mannosyltransferase
MNYETVAAWCLRRRYVAVAVGVLLWGIWGIAIVFGNSELPRPQPEGSWSAFRLQLGNGAWDWTHQIVSIDHLAFYAPMRMIHEGRDGEIYNHAILAPYQDAIFPNGYFEGKLEAYRNPPFYVLLHAATAKLPYAVSAAIWNAIGFGCLLLGIGLLRPEKFWRVVFWSMTFLPTFTVISYGQTSLVSFATFCGVYRLLEKKQHFLAGLLSSFLLFKPPLLMGLFVWWLMDFRRFRTAILGAFLGGLLILAVSYPLVPNAWNAFLSQLPENVRFDNFEWWKSHNARAFWRLVLTTDAAPVPTLLWGVSALVGIGVFYRVWRVQRDNLPCLYGASILLMLWASPHTMIYEWVAAIIPAVLWLKHFPTWQSRWVCFIAMTWLAMFASTELGHLQDVAFRRLGWENPMILQLSIPVFVVVCVGVVRTFTGANRPSATAIA